MVCHFDTNLLLLVPISPVENTSLLGEDFERAQLFAVELDYLDCLEGSVDHQVAGLEANQLRERER